MRLIALVVMLTLLMTACDNTPSAVPFEDVPLAEGDPGSGAKLFEQSLDESPTCISCHQISDVALVGPGLENYGSRAGSRVEGESAELYTYNSIVRPAKHILTGYSNIMYQDYGQKINAQDLADLIAYLLSL